MLLPEHMVFYSIYTKRATWSFTNVYLRFLSDRCFKVCVWNIYSDVYSQEAGLPQGSKLSVPLFGLKMNIIISSLLPDIM